jgi:hypothetical protein
MLDNAMVATLQRQMGGVFRFRSTGGETREILGQIDQAAFGADWAL